MTNVAVHYISDEKGKVTGVIVPIDLWGEIASELETTYLLRSEPMKQRLLEALNRRSGMPLDEVLEKLGI